MEVLKLWIRINSQFSRAEYAEDTGSGLFIFDVGDKFIISTKQSDDILVTSNIPDIITGNFTIQRSRPIDGNYLYKSDTENAYIVVASYGYLFFNNGLKPNDPIYDKWRYNTDGEALTSPTYFGIDKDAFNGQNLFANEQSYVKYMITDGSNEGTVIADARTAFNAKEYELSLSDANNWQRWERLKTGGLAGEYQPFGGASGTKTVGYLEYEDTESASYVKGFDITEEDDVWSVVYNANGQKYITTTEPSNSDATFSNNEATPQNITLSFISYTAYDKPMNTFTVGQLLQ